MLGLFTILLVISLSVSIRILRASSPYMLSSWWQDSFYEETSQHFFKASSPSSLCSALSFSTNSVLDYFMLPFPTYFPSLILPYFFFFQYNLCFFNLVGNLPDVFIFCALSLEHNKLHEGDLLVIHLWGISFHLTVTYILSAYLVMTLHNVVLLFAIRDRALIVHLTKVIPARTQFRDIWLLWKSSQ